MSNENNNNVLYLIIGILLTIVVLGGFFLLGTDQGDDVIKETNTVVERTIEGEEGSSFELKIGDDGFSASSKTQN